MYIFKQVEDMGTKWINYSHTAHYYQSVSNIRKMFVAYKLTNNLHI